MVQFVSAGITRVAKGHKYVLCIFDKGSKPGWHLQWVRANKCGEE